MFRTQKRFKNLAALLALCCLGGSVPCHAVPAKTQPSVKAPAIRQEPIPTFAAYGYATTIRFHMFKYNVTCLTYVKPGTQAEISGLRPQDAVFRVNDIDTPTPFHLESELARNKGLPKKIEYFRNTGKGYVAKQVTTGEVFQFKDRTGKPLKRATQAEMEDYLITLINADRSKNGLSGSLRKSSGLSRMARSYADDMAKRNFHGHRDPEGRDPWARAKLAGINSINIRENCAYPFREPDSFAMVRAGESQLMDSPEHKISIVQPDNKCVGCGIAYRGDGGLMVVQVFSPDDIP